MAMALALLDELWSRLGSDSNSICSLTLGQVSDWVAFLWHITYENPFNKTDKKDVKSRLNGKNRH